VLVDDPLGVVEGELSYATLRPKELSFIRTLTLWPVCSDLSIRSVTDASSSLFPKRSALPSLDLLLFHVDKVLGVMLKRESTRHLHLVTTHLFCHIHLSTDLRGHEQGDVVLPDHGKDALETIALGLGVVTDLLRQDGIGVLGTTPYDTRDGVDDDQLERKTFIAHSSQLMFDTIKNLFSLVGLVALVTSLIDPVHAVVLLAKLGAVTQLGIELHSPGFRVIPMELTDQHV
jgi:hypothetical protein